ncbi:DUF4397 domain-containing protein [Silvibacterium sp.]|uniref:DUF4397 domain-containing protein n=1 Tax=Silvibacterium sp. TaxID=1964179 RepID=UPI0039E47B4D
MSRTTRQAAAVLATVGAMALAGCESVQTTSQSTLLRMIDASTNAQGVDMYVNGTEIVSNQGAPGISNYGDVASGSTTIKVYPTGKTTPVDAQVTGTLAAGGQYSLLLTDNGTGETATLLTDQTATAPSSDFALRIVQEASAVGGVDVYLVTPGTLSTTTSTSTTTTTTLADLTPLVTDLGAGSTMAYTDEPAGTYEIVIEPTGVTDLTKAYTISSTTFSSGAVRTMLVANASATSTSKMTTVIADDVD